MHARRAATYVLVALFLLTATVVLAAAVTYTPPPRSGTIYTVIDYKRSLGTTRPTAVSVSWGSFNRSGTIASPLDSCSQAVHSGFVLTLQHLKADSVPLTVSTDGTFIRTPYQGAAPAEAGLPCYKVVNW